MRLASAGFGHLVFCPLVSSAGRAQTTLAKIHRDLSKALDFNIFSAVNPNRLTAEGTGLQPDTLVT